MMMIKMMMTIIIQLIIYPIHIAQPVANTTITAQHIVIKYTQTQYMHTLNEDHGAGD